MICELCERDVFETTFHHLIPVTLHTNKWIRTHYEFDYLKTHGIDLCHHCHHAVHDFFDEKTLGREYNTLELLLANEQIQKHIKWAKKQK